LNIVAASCQYNTMDWSAGYTIILLNSNSRKKKEQTKRQVQSDKQWWIWMDR
jgi:hypothetical protein